MRKHRPLVGWPRPDPRHYRFPLPNAIWEYNLKPTEFVILSYLCCFHSHCRNNEKVSAEPITNAVHMTTGTVKKYLSSLVVMKLITDEFSLVPALQLADDRMFFTLPNEIFLLNLPSSAFMVYAYLLLVEDRNTHTCHPSYNTIANQTGIARNTVIKSIGVLLDAKLITTEHSRYFDKHGMKWKGNNLYTVLPTQQAVDAFHQRQLCQLELDAERRRVRQRQEAYDRRHPRASLCAPTAPDPIDLSDCAGLHPNRHPCFALQDCLCPACRMGNICTPIKD